WVAVLVLWKRATNLPTRFPCAGRSTKSLTHDHYLDYLISLPAFIQRQLVSLCRLSTTRLHKLTTVGLTCWPDLGKKVLVLITMENEFSLTSVVAMKVSCQSDSRL